MNLIRVCNVGLGKRSKIDEIKDDSPHGGEADSFDHVGFDGGPLMETITRHRPHVYLVWDSNTNPKWRGELLACPLSIRRQCIEVSESEPGPQIYRKVMACYLDFLNDDRFPHLPLVSVFTPVYNREVYRPFNSLLEQTYPNWEWVIFDDSDSNEAKHGQSIEKCAEHDMRVRVFRERQHCGIVGEMKRRAASLSHGQILVELDHDDELTSNALADCVAAFQAFPDAGFAYSDCAGIRASDGAWQNYGDDWAMGYGPKIRFEFYKGRQLGIMPAPPLNSKTVRHIISTPNHFRAWRRDAYFAAGGHSPHVHVCDDFELFIRTFLSTRCVYIPKLGYIQYLGDGNTQYERFGEIHRLVRYFRGHYDRQIHERIMELSSDFQGVVNNADFCWNGEYGDLNKPNEKNPPKFNYVFGAGQKAAENLADELDVTHDFRPGAYSMPTVPATPKDSPPMVAMTAGIPNDKLSDYCEMSTMAINYAANQKMIIVDDFYADPMAVRAFALKQEYHEAQSTPNKGLRSKKFLFHGLRDRIQMILGETIPVQSWENGDSANGCFQVTFSKSQRVFHCDQQAYAGAIYLTPIPEKISGTELIRSLETGKPMPASESDILDESAWYTVAESANIFNRLVIWDGRHAHCASGYFGDTLENGRLVQLFFFEVE